MPESELAEAYERAAKVCEELGPRFYHGEMHDAADSCAAAIRALKAK